MLAALFSLAPLAAADLSFVPGFTWGERGYGGFREPSLLLVPGRPPRR